MYIYILSFKYVKIYNIMLECTMYCFMLYHLILYSILLYYFLF